MGIIMNLNQLNKKIAALPIGERFSVSGLPDTVYHAADGIGSSLMREACISMAHYRVAKDTPREQTAAMVFGQAVHCAVLEPELFEQKVAVMPEGMARGVTKKYAEFAQAHPNQLHLKEEEKNHVEEMALAILVQCPTLFVDGEPEKSFWYRHESGIVLKARLDFANDDGGVDLKTSRFDDAEAFERTARKEWAIQDAHYRMVSGVLDYLFVGVAKDAPYQAFILRQGQDVIERCTNKINEVAKQIAFCEELKSFPLPPCNHIIETHYPSWDNSYLQQATA